MMLILWQKILLAWQRVVLLILTIFTYVYTYIFTHHIKLYFNIVLRNFVYIVSKILIYILFLRKIATLKFSNELGSKPLLAWKRASWVQETCLLIQATLLRTALRFFHKEPHECFGKDYEHLFHSPQHLGVGFNVLGPSPIYMPAARW